MSANGRALPLSLLLPPAVVAPKKRRVLRGYGGAASASKLPAVGAAGPSVPTRKRQATVMPMPAAAAKGRAPRGTMMPGRGAAGPQLKRPGRMQRFKGGPVARL